MLVRYLVFAVVVGTRMAATAAVSICNSMSKYFVPVSFYYDVC